MIRKKDCHETTAQHCCHLLCVHKKGKHLLFIHSDPLCFHDVKLLVSKLSCRCFTFQSPWKRLIIVTNVQCLVQH